MSAAVLSRLATYAKAIAVNPRGVLSLPETLGTKYKKLLSGTPGTAPTGALGVMSGRGRVNTARFWDGD